MTSHWRLLFLRSRNPESHSLTLNCNRIESCLQYGFSHHWSHKCFAVFRSSLTCVTDWSLPESPSSSESPSAPASYTCVNGDALEKKDSGSWQTSSGKLTFSQAAFSSVKGATSPELESLSESDSSSDDIGRDVLRFLEAESPGFDFDFVLFGILYPSELRWSSEGRS